MLTKEQFQRYKQAAYREYRKKNYQRSVSNCDQAIACEPVLMTPALKAELGDVFYQKSRALFQLSKYEQAQEPVSFAIKHFVEHKGTHDPITQEAFHHLSLIKSKLHEMQRIKDVLSQSEQRPDFEVYYKKLCEDSTKIVPVIAFPKYTLQCFNYTSSHDILEDGTKNDLLKCFVSFSQMSGYINAQQFVIEHVLEPSTRADKSNAFNLKPAQLIRLIKATHYMMFNVLSIANRGGTPGGIYTPTAVHIPRETGIPGKHYSSDYGSEENIQTLKKNGTSDEEIAQLKAFLLAYDSAYEQVDSELERLLNQEGGSVEDVQRAQSHLEMLSVIETNHLDEHPGYPIFRRLIDAGLRSSLISAAMETFAHELIDKLKNEKDPFKIARFVLLELSRILPFSIGNGRVMRLWASVVLMLHGFPPPMFPNFVEYYEVFERCYHGDGDFAAVLKSWVAPLHNSKQLEDVCDYDKFDIQSDHYVATWKDHAFTMHGSNVVCNTDYFFELANEFHDLWSKLDAKRCATKIKQYQHAQVISLHMCSALMSFPNPYHESVSLSNLISGNLLGNNFIVLKYHYYRLAYDYFKYLPNNENYEEAKEKFHALAYMKDILADEDIPEACQALMDKYKTSNLDVALRRAAGKGDLPDLQVLSQYAYSIDVRDNTAYGHNALFQACIYRKTDCANYLLESGANPDAKEKLTGLTPRYYDRLKLVNWLNQTDRTYQVMMMPFGSKAGLGY